MNNRLRRAIKILKRDCRVNPKEYAVYRNGYIFRVNTPGLVNMYLVDMDVEKAGPFSAVLDMQGYLNIANTFKPI